MNIKQLRTIAKEKGVSGYGAMTKAQLEELVYEAPPVFPNMEQVEHDPLIAVAEAMCKPEPKKVRKSHGRRFQVCELSANQSMLKSWNKTKTREYGLSLPPQLQELADDLIENHVGKTGTLKELAEHVKVRTTQSPYRIIAWYAKNLKDLGVLVEVPKQ